MEKPIVVAEWLKVTERLPEEGDVSPVLAVLADAVDEELRLAMCDADYVRAHALDFTHWLAVPPLPEHTID